MAGNLYAWDNNFKLDSAKSLVGGGGNCSGCFSEWSGWGGSAETTEACGMKWHDEMKAIKAAQRDGFYTGFRDLDGLVI